MMPGAYVPCYNNAATVRSAVESLLQQTLAPAEVLVIDDGSTDGSAERLAGLPVRVVRLERNRGRGAARARAMTELSGELVLCCDATNVLPRDFAAKACGWFERDTVAAVFGRICDPRPRGVAGRWRARHLFKQEGAPAALNRRATLSTYGAVVRRSAAAAVGGYDAALRHTEDADLGHRLLTAGFEVLFDPALAAEANVTNTAPEVLERYWRWHAGHDEAFNPGGYVRHAWYAARTMAGTDLRHRDYAAAGLSLCLPLFILGQACTRPFRRDRRSRVDAPEGGKIDAA